MKGLIILLLSASYSSLAQAISEEKALEYFLDNIFPTVYSELPRLNFSKKTEIGFSDFWLGDNCFDKSDFQFKIALGEAAMKNEVDKSRHKIRLNGYKGRFSAFSKYKLRVFKATRLGQLQYVLIAVYNDHSENFFIIELNTSSSEVTRFCQNALIY